MANHCPICDVKYPDSAATHCVACGRRRPQSDDNTKFREAALECYAGDLVNIDADADVSIGEDGAWVQAWVFVGNADL